MYAAQRFVSVINCFWSRVRFSEVSFSFDILNKKIKNKKITLFIKGSAWRLVSPGIRTRVLQMESVTNRAAALNCFDLASSVLCIVIRSEFCISMNDCCLIY